MRLIPVGFFIIYFIYIYKEFVPLIKYFMTKLGFVLFVLEAEATWRLCADFIAPDCIFNLP